MVKTLPAHVPEAVVRDFDYFCQPELLTEPHSTISSLFAGLRPRIIFTPRNGGHWIIAGYRELFAAFRDTDTFSSTSMQIPAMAEEPKLIPLNMDPPEHAIYRAPLAAAFRHERIATLEGQIRSLTRQLIDEIEADGAAEFVSAVAEPLPIYIFLGILGVPREKFRLFRRSVKEYLANPTDRSGTAAQLDQDIAELIEDKRTRPGDDLLSTLMSEKIGDHLLTFEDLMSYCRLLMLAGLDTVTNAMSFGMRRLATDAALQQELRQDRSRIPAAAEELLRRYAIANMGRIVVRDAELLGVQFRKGDRVLFMPAGAGLDPDVYPEPAQVQVERQRKTVPTFGFGRHHCVGSHLARLELKVLYEEWLDRIPSFVLQKGTTPRFHGGVVMGLEQLHLAWPS